MSKEREDLIKAWRGFSPKSRPYILSGDELILQGTKKGEPIFNSYYSFEEYRKHGDYNDPQNTKLNLGLLPVPYSGDLENAKIYVLMINPGLGDLDYVAEEKFVDYRAALDQSRRQSNQLLKSRYPMIFLDPQFSWTGGGQYWIKKLRNFISLQREAQNCSMADAMSHLSKRICCIEYLPYHSVKFKNGRFLHTLKSTCLIRGFILKDIVPRAKRGEVGIIVRGQQYWQIPEDRLTGKEKENVVFMKGPHAIGAHLGIKTEAGKLIARFL
jgi:hypothetical protein